MKRCWIPAAVFADEGTAPVVGGKIGTGGHHQSQWGDVRAQRVVRRDRGGHQVGPLWHDARVQMLAVIAVGPAIEASVPYRRQIIRNQVGPYLVTFVGDGPELASLRLPLKPGRIAHSAGEDSVRA